MSNRATECSIDFFVKIRSSAAWEQAMYPRYLMLWDQDLLYAPQSNFHVLG